MPKTYSGKSWDDLVVGQEFCEALTRCLAVEWARHGIQVNCLAPGYMATDFNQEPLADERMRRRILSRIPARRVGEPDELGPLAVYLASPARSSRATCTARSPASAGAPSR